MTGCVSTAALAGYRLLRKHLVFLDAAFVSSYCSDSIGSLVLAWSMASSDICNAPTQVRQEDALALAAAIEVGNDHPIASAIVNHAQLLLAPETLFGGSGGSSGKGQTPKGQTPRASASTPRSPLVEGKYARQLDWVWPALSADVIHGAPSFRFLQSVKYRIVAEHVATAACFARR